MTSVPPRSEPLRPEGIDTFGLLARFAPLIFLIVLMAIFATAQPRFLSTINLLNVLRQVSISGLLAIGMTFVILTAGIDLSVGSLLALCGLAAAVVSKGSTTGNFGSLGGAAGYGWGAALLVAVLIGIAGGALQGTAITKAKVPPFVVTLGGMSVFRGAALLLSGGGPISGFGRRLSVLGPGPRLGTSDAGPHLHRLRHSGPPRAALHAVRAPDLRRRRQSRGGAPVRAQGAAHPAQRLCHHGLLLGARRLRARRPAELGRSRRGASATS